MADSLTPDQYAKFIESLKVTKEGPEEMHWRGIRFDRPLESFTHPHNIPHQYWVARTRRAESNAKPSDLAEQVKGFMRAGMEAECERFWSANTAEWTQRKNNAEEFRKLSEATKVKR